ncbi:MULTISPECIES: type II toxin-antitoxin system VapB family antitoxin [unclassified Rhizobium]
MRTNIELDDDLIAEAMENYRSLYRKGDSEKGAAGSRAHSSSNACA